MAVFEEAEEFSRLYIQNLCLGLILVLGKNKLESDLFLLIFWYLWEDLVYFIFLITY